MTILSLKWKLSIYGKMVFILREGPDGFETLQDVMIRCLMGYRNFIFQFSYKELL